MKYAIWIVIATSWYIRGMNDCDAAQFRFSGQLSYVDDPSGVLPPEIHVDAPFAGTLFFGVADDLLPEDPSRGEYRFAGQSAGVRIEIGGQFVQSSNADPFALEVDNDVTYYPFDSPGNVQPAMDFFWIRDGVWTHSLGAEQVKIELFWINEDANVFSSDALPAVLDASDFKSLSRSVISPDLIPATIDITGGTPIDIGGIGQPGFVIRAQLQDIQVVPEPSSGTYALIGCALTLAMLLTRYSRRTSALAGFRSACKTGRNVRVRQPLWIRRLAFEEVEGRLHLSASEGGDLISSAVMDDFGEIRVLGGIIGSQQEDAKTLGGESSDKVSESLSLVFKSLTSQMAQHLGDAEEGIHLSLVHDFNADYRGTAYVDESGSVQVYVYFDRLDDSVLDQLRKTDAIIQLVDTSAKIVQAMATKSVVGNIANISDVRRIALPVYAYANTGDPTTVGDSIHRANEVRSQFSSLGIDGTGVRIGVISGGIEHCATVANETPNPNLPAAITVNPNLSGDPTNDEGTAMLEIVHDIAPGADLFFSGFASDGTFTSLQMRAGIQWMIDNGVDVIVDDLTFYAEPYFEDGEGTVAHRVKDAIIAGITYVTSAGNTAQRHYQGVFESSGGGFPLRHDFDASGSTDSFLRFRLPAGAKVGVHLQWSDPWGASNNDYNLALWNDPPTAVLATSATQQDGNDNPYESILNIANNGQQDAFLNISVVKTAAAAVRELEIFISQSGETAIVDDEVTPADSVQGHAAVEGVIAVGAIEATSPFDSVWANSARGPSTVYTDFATQTKVLRNSLDGVAVHGVQTRVGQLGHYSNPFRGTSAAAPHVAGIIALMHSAHDALTVTAGDRLTPSQVATILKNTAIDIRATGYDSTSGAGRFDALDAVVAVMAQPKVARVTVRNTSDVHGGYHVKDRNGTSVYWGQIATAPVGNGLNQITIGFTKPVLVDAADLIVIGGGGFGEVHSSTAFSYNPTNYTGTWTFDTIYRDQLWLKLDGTSANGVKDSSGNLLDGEWINPTGYDDNDPDASIFPSGNGEAGGDFEFAVTVLTGDADRFGRVTLADLAALQRHLGTTSGAIWEDGDVTGDGAVTRADAAAMAASWGVDYREWPTGGESLTSGGGSGGGGEEMLGGGEEMLGGGGEETLGGGEEMSGGGGESLLSENPARIYITLSGSTSGGGELPGSVPSAQLDGPEDTVTLYVWANLGGYEFMNGYGLDIRATNEDVVKATASTLYNADIVASNYGNAVVGVRWDGNLAQPTINPDGEGEESLARGASVFTLTSGGGLHVANDGSDAIGRLDELYDQANGAFLVQSVTLEALSGSGGLSTDIVLYIGEMAFSLDNTPGASYLTFGLGENEVANNLVGESDGTIHATITVAAQGPSALVMHVPSVAPATAISLGSIRPVVASSRPERLRTPSIDVAVEALPKHENRLAVRRRATSLASRTITNDVGATYTRAIVL